MTIEEYRALAAKLYPQLDKASNALKFFDQFKEANGLLPDRIRNGEMYSNAKAIFDCAFNLVRNMNKEAGAKLLKEVNRKNKEKQCYDSL